MGLRMLWANFLAGCTVSSSPVACVHPAPASAVPIAPLAFVDRDKAMYAVSRVSSSCSARRFGQPWFTGVLLITAAAVQREQDAKPHVALVFALVISSRANGLFLVDLLAWVGLWPYCHLVRYLGFLFDTRDHCVAYRPDHRECAAQQPFSAHPRPAQARQAQQAGGDARPDAAAEGAKAEDRWHGVLRMGRADPELLVVGNFKPNQQAQ